MDLTDIREAFRACGGVDEAVKKYGTYIVFRDTGIDDVNGLEARVKLRYLRFVHENDFYTTERRPDVVEMMAQQVLEQAQKDYDMKRDYVAEHVMPELRKKAGKRGVLAKVEKMREKCGKSFWEKLRSN